MRDLLEYNLHCLGNTEIELYSYYYYYHINKVSRQTRDYKRRINSEAQTSQKNKKKPHTQHMVMSKASRWCS